MSHIVKGKLEVTYTNKELLLKALNGLGQVVEHEKLYRVGFGYTSETYPVVLIDPSNTEYRIGYREKNGVWEQYQENYGKYGHWTKLKSDLIQDRYIAFHYERELIDEGFNVSMKQHQDGTIELEALEKMW